MTLYQAKSLKPGQILHHVHNKNADGSPQRWRVNGNVTTWKRSPSRVRVPIKQGLRDHDYLTESTLDLLTFPEGA